MNNDGNGLCLNGGTTKPNPLVGFGSGFVASKVGMSLKISSQVGFEFGCI